MVNELISFLHDTYTIALPIVLGYIVWMLQKQSTDRMDAEKKQKRETEKSNKGMMLLLRIQLIEYHDKYMEKGEIPSYAYDNFCEMYDSYHDLGGNGMITKMKDEIDTLHLGTKGDGSNEQKRVLD